MANNKSSITVTRVAIDNITQYHGKHFYTHGGKYYLVRGIGKRAIVAMIRPLMAADDFPPSEDIAKIAAQFAAKEGWKKVVIENYCDGLHVYNLNQYNQLVRDYISEGKLLPY